MNERLTKAVKTNQSLTKALHIIELMAETRGPMRLQDIAHFTTLPTSTALRFLNTLMQQGYVTQDRETQRYSLSFKLCQIAEQIRIGHQLTDIVHPYLEELTRLVGESSCMAVEESREVVYVDVVEGPMSLLQTLQRIGKRAPLYSTGVGKSLLLNYRREEIEALIEEKGITPLTSRTVKDLSELLEEVEQVKLKGFGLDNEECEEGVRCIAAPVRDYTGRVACSISVSGPTKRMTMKRVQEISETVMRIAGQASTRLGYIEAASDSRKAPTQNRPLGQ
jgi:DNA-binding IclR family transcriptional regulator